MRLIAALLACTWASAQAPDFHPLFDGKSLGGWAGDARLWSVQNGEIVGSTEAVKIENNSFLVYRRASFSDFTLRAEVKLRNHNSGIQFRSEELPGWIVRGYQADMAEKNWWGSIYEERGTRGVMVNGWKGKAETVVKPGQWNEVEVFCQGELIRIKVNGLVTAELRDSAKLAGIIALQIHKGPPMQVRFRNIRISGQPQAAPAAP